MLKSGQKVCIWVYVLVLHTLIYIFTQGTDWLVERVDGECVLRSEYQTRQSSAAPPQSPPVSIASPVRTSCLCPYLLTAHQPAATSVHQKQKGPSKSVHCPKAAIAHEPLDLQPIEEVFNEDTADDMVTNIPMSHFSAPEDFDHRLDFNHRLDFDHRLDFNPLPPTPTLPCPKKRKRPADDIGKQIGMSHPKHVKRSEGLLGNGLDSISSAESTVLALSAPLSPLPLATQSMVSIPL